MSNTASVTLQTGTAYHSRAPEFTFVKGLYVDILWNGVQMTTIDITIPTDVL